MIRVCDIVHSAVHTEYSVATVGNLAASRRRNWWEKLHILLVQSLYLKRTYRFFHFPDEQSVFFPEIAVSGKSSVFYSHL